MTRSGAYHVGPGETYKSVQAAIESLIADQGTTPFTATQRIVVGPGVYGPFRLEPDVLRPTEEFRLSIEAAQDALPVISGRQNPSGSQVGCLVGNNVPYVTIQGLLFRDLIKGIVFGVNSHRGVVNRCFVLDCGNAGVWFYQADECVLANSLVVNCDHGLATTKVRSVGVFHNTFFNDTGFSRKNQKTYCIFLDLQEDRGQGEEDTGRAHLYNNIIYSLSDFGILLHEKDVTHITSDYNDWYCPNSETVHGQDPTGGLAEIREQVLDVVHKDFVTRLHTDDLFASEQDWRLRTGQDLHSIADDPGFIKPAVNRESSIIDLSLLKDSPVLGKGHVFTSGLPAWFTDYALLAFDFHEKPRLQSSCAIGAHEANVRSDWFGASLFAGGNSEFTEPDGGDLDPALDDECEGDVFSFDRAAAAYAHAVPAWYPKAHRGSFFVRDAGYHLYVQKKGVYLQDMKRTSFSMPSRAIEDGLRVWLAGQEITDDATWYVNGYTFVLYHKGLDFDYDETSDVVVEAQHRYWESSSGAFATKWTRQVWKLNQGHTEYCFPTPVVAGEPVVVTDDLIEPGNRTGLEQEFRVSYDTERDETKLELGGVKNLWANSDFSYVDLTTGFYLIGITQDLQTGYYPRDYRLESTGAFMVAMERFITTTGMEFTPVRGKRALVMGPGNLDDFVEQRVRVDPEKAYSITAHGASIAATPQSIRVSLDFLDADRQVIQTHGPFNAHLPVGIAPDIGWVRFGFPIYREPSTERGLPPFSSYAVELTTGITMPATTDEVALRFHPGTGLSYVALDAIQFEEGYRPGLYTRIPKGTDVTVEYEEAQLRFHEISTLSMQPIRNAHGRGFLSIIPVPARQWDAEALPYATTLTDQWPWGRVNLLPWAKLSGFGNKYRNTPLFSTRERVPPTEPISLSPNVALPGEIRVEPAVIQALQGSEGEIFSVEVLDQHRNPYAFERLRASIMDPTGEFPGYLATQEWGFFTRLGQQLVMRLSEAGTAVLRWIPPEPEEVEYRGVKPVTSQASVAYVDTWYRVYPFNHGSLTLRDHLNQKLSLESDMLTGGFAGIFADDHTVLSLQDYPVPGSVDVFASITGEAPGTRLLESFGAPVPNRHYRVDYERGMVLVPGVWENPFRVEYRRRLAFVDPSFPRRVYFHSEALDLVTGDLMAVQYDAQLDLVLEALAPTGVPESVKTTFITLGVVAQHRDREVGL